MIKGYFNSLSFAQYDKRGIKKFILLPPTLWHKSILPLTLNENRSKIAITAESREEADILFNGLSAGGSVEMPLEESF